MLALPGNCELTQLWGSCVLGRIPWWDGCILQSTPGLWVADRCVQTEHPCFVSLYSCHREGVQGPAIRLDGNRLKLLETVVQKNEQ